jgi:hypothetical protein
VEAGVIEQGEWAYLWTDGIYEKGIGKEKSVIALGSDRRDLSSGQGAALLESQYTQCVDAVSKKRTKTG